MIPFALTLRFVLELNALAAVAIWGFRAGGGGIGGVAYAAAAVVVLAVNWAWFIAPRSERSPIPVRWRTLVGGALMLVAAALLAIAGEPVPAILFAALVIADTAALYALGAADQQWPVLASAAPRPPEPARAPDRQRRPGRSPAATRKRRRR